jgi:hypothetical protein
MCKFLSECFFVDLGLLSFSMRKSRPEVERGGIDDRFGTKSFEKMQEKVSGTAALRATTVPEDVSDRLLR